MSPLPILDFRIDALIGLSFLVSPSVAAPARPKIAVVLSGGAARGSAHVGVLKVLEEQRIPVDFICGTSMGAIVGGLYATGMSPAEMEQHLTSANWNDLFLDRPARQYLSYRRKQEDMISLIKFELGWDHGLTFPAGLVAGDKLIFFLRTLTLQTHDGGSFDGLPIPFRAVATDIETGDMVVLDHGDLPVVLRASMAIPGMFSPQEIEGRLLADGFLAENLPVNVARAWGADVIIAVDVGTPLSPRSELKTMFQISGQALSIMSQKNTRTQISLLGPKDVLIQPELGSLSGLNFERSAEAIDAGAKAAAGEVEALRAYALSEADYADWKTGQRQQAAATLRVDGVRVEGAGRVADATIRRRASRLASGEEVKVGTLRRILDRIYDLGAFDTVDFGVTNENGHHDLLIRPRERTDGTVRVRAGLTLFSDIDGDSNFNFLTSVTATELNPLGGEWNNQVQFGRTTRLFSEWYQPLEAGRLLFVAPRVEFAQDRVDSNGFNGLLYRAKFRRLEFGTDAGLQLANFGELRLGPVWSRTSAYELLGVTLPGGITQATEAGARMRLVFDQLDNVDFPKHGHYGGFELITSRKELGADLNHNRGSAAWMQAYTFGKNTLVGGFELNGKLGPDLPFYENFSLGGFLSLSGYPYGGLTDQYSGITRLVYYRQIAGRGSRLFGALYAGGSVETGGVWRRARDIGSDGLMLAGSAFVGAETLFGPLYLAYGQAERSHHAFYFYLGRGF